MAQFPLALPTVGPLPGPTLVEKSNEAFETLATQNAGPAAPATTYPLMPWFDTTNNLLKIRNEADDAWVIVASLVGNVWIPYRDGVAVPAIPAPGAADAGRSLVATGADAFGLVGPFSGLTNRIINGDHRIAQNGASLAAIASGSYSCDQWSVVNTSGAVITAAQVADHPLLGANGFSQRIQFTTADAAVAAGDVVAIVQPIEGYNVADLLATGAPIAVALWLKSSKTGIHCGALCSAGLDRSYPFELNVAVAGTWQRFVVPITLNFAGGTWNYTNGVGLYVRITAMAGATFKAAAAGAWQNGNFYAGPNQVNVADTLNNTLQIADAMLVPGSAAPVFERRPIGVELALCERYFQKTFALAQQPIGGTGQGTGELQYPSSGAASNGCWWDVRFRTRMRAAPTVTIYNPVVGNNQVRNSTVNGDCTSTLAANQNETGFFLSTTNNPGGGVNNLLIAHYSASARF